MSGAGHFADRLAAAVRARGNAVCVGLDPRLEHLPPGLVRDRSAKGISDAYRSFCEVIIETVAGLVPVVKPQSACFEEIGPEGVHALQSTIAFAEQRGLLVILDAKRGDIGSTSEAYARGLLKGPMFADAVTVSPYLGGDSLDPFVKTAIERGAGIFVLVKTSNPGGAMFQDLVVDGRPVYRHVASLVEQLAERTKGACGYGAVGAVVGATYPEQLVELRAAMPHAWILVPGYGAQGGQARDVVRALDKDGLGALVNSSRGIIFAHARSPYREQFSPDRWQDAVAAATREMIAELANARTA
jgi:orotidine-5'-phosphate decarboxylase